MQRKCYTIKMNGEKVDTRTAFNACNRAVESLARTVARNRGEVFHLVDSSTVKDEFKNGVSGVRVWASPTHRLEFLIERVS